VLGLPKGTELNKQLPKKAVYAKFQMNTAAKETFDADISKITIVNEISPAKVAIEVGETVKSFFVMQVTLKKKEFNEKTIALLSKLILQNVLLILDYYGESKLAVYHTKLIQTDWQPIVNFTVQLKGLNLDAIWENIIVQVGGIQIEQSNSLDEQIAIDEQRAKLQKEIEHLEKLARSEKQPKKKFELAQQLNKLQSEAK